MTDRFIALGHTVIGCGRSREHIDELRKLYVAPHAFTVLDVTDNKAVQAWAKDVLASHGPPDLLLNNAAIMNKNAPLWQVPAEEFDRLIDINIKGVANILRAFAPAMVEERKGVIVNFSSGWGRSTSPEVAPYCASKYAIEGLSSALAQELPRGMATVAFNPGIIDTDMLRESFGSGASSYPSPRDWAVKVVPFLLNLGPKHNGQALSAP
jgi:NAD(P)-dependent dehydrogenase (short-subunit alcohol dehydrogenase family)